MKNIISSFSKFVTFTAIFLATFSLSPATMYGESYLPYYVDSYQYDLGEKIRQLELRVSLIETVNLNCGPVTISNVHLGNQNTCITTLPGQSIECSLRYKLDSSQQHFLEKHHLIVGLEGVGVEACITHLYGVWDSVGTKKFKLISPLEQGDYEVKVAYYACDTCEDAFNKWNVLRQEPCGLTTIGILRVRYDAK
jgi:hypothetical protein